jgi:hypothetical protein
MIPGMTCWTCTERSSPWPSTRYTGRCLKGWRCWTRMPMPLQVHTLGQLLVGKCRASQLQVVASSQSPYWHCICAVTMQYLKEHGYNSALSALERESGVLFVDEKLAQGSELLQVRSPRRQLGMGFLKALSMLVMPDFASCHFPPLELHSLISCASRWCTSASRRG